MADSGRRLTKGAWGLLSSLIAVAACSGDGSHSVDQRFMVDGSTAPRFDMTSPPVSLAASLPDSDKRKSFVAWLEAHPEVTAATLNHDHPIARARYSDGEGTVVCGVQSGRSACVRHPSPVRHLWTLGYRRRENGHGVLSAAIGPLAGDAHHAQAYEFRLPEASVISRGLYPIGEGLGDSAAPSWALELREPWPRPPKGTWQQPKDESPLPSVVAPSWVFEDGYEVGYVNAVPGPVLNADSDGTTLFCQRGALAWRCFPPLRPPSRAEADPGHAHEDARVKQIAPWPRRAAARCDAGAACTLLVEWEWQRTLIAHSYRSSGSFVTLHRVERAGPAHLLGWLRIGIGTEGFLRDVWAYLEPRFLDGDCVELTAREARKNNFTPRPRAKDQLPAPGRYCAASDGSPTLTKSP